ncbi:MAG: hypothetical protein IPK08_18480 [Bacteroidetes bacterium]|nr:hypothetical protein [Bacteroidota bacterium]
MNGKTAIIFGSTGLTGSYLLDFWCSMIAMKKIIRFIRKPSKISHPKIKDIISNLDDLSAHKNEIHGDEVYICLGTTIKVAGSQAAFRKVDYEFPVQIAEIAAENRIPVIAVISSIGADAASSNFYLKTKRRNGNCHKFKKYKVHLLFQTFHAVGRSQRATLRRIHNEKSDAGFILSIYWSAKKIQSNSCEKGCSFHDFYSKQHSTFQGNFI